MVGSLIASNGRRLEYAVLGDAAPIGPIGLPCGARAHLALGPRQRLLRFARMHVLVLRGVGAE
eukprot:573797-Prymnesium_polylepis.9